MTIVESLQLERSKNPNEIILFKEGSFWRAYEMSAFVCCKYNPQTSLKPTKRSYKDIDEECIFIGFPIKSISNYLPDIDSKVSYNDDMNIMTINIVDFLSIYEGNIQADFESWKNEGKCKTKEFSDNPNIINSLIYMKV